MIAPAFQSWSDPFPRILSLRGEVLVGLGADERPNGRRLSWEDPTRNTEESGTRVDMRVRAADVRSRDPPHDGVVSRPHAAMSGSDRLTFVDWRS